MNLKINSNSARLYRWFYATQKMPESLCPYFWKLVIMWSLIVPYSIISLPLIVLKYDRDKSTTERAVVGMLFWFLLFIGISMIFFIGIFWIDLKDYKKFSAIFATGLVGWAASVTIAILGLIHWLKDKWKSRHIRYDENGYRIYTDPVKQDSILVSFVKAKYNKYCPKINWKYDK
jgi:hypothetical protein